MKAIPVSDLIIRNAVLDDVPLVLEFVNGTAEYEHLCHIVLDSVSVGFVAFFQTFRQSETCM